MTNTLSNNNSSKWKTAFSQLLHEQIKSFFANTIKLNDSRRESLICGSKQRGLRASSHTEWEASKVLRTEENSEILNRPPPPIVFISSPTTAAASLLPHTGDTQSRGVDDLFLSHTQVERASFELSTVWWALSPLYSVRIGVICYVLSLWWAWRICLWAYCLGRGVCEHVCWLGLCASGPRWETDDLMFVGACQWYRMSSHQGHICVKTTAVLKQTNNNNKTNQYITDRHRNNINCAGLSVPYSLKFKTQHSIVWVTDEG